MSNADTIIDKLEEATKAAFALAREMAASRRDGDEWTRLPSPSERCHVSGFSRSKICRLIEAGEVRAKSVSGGRYYAAADVRKIITESQA